MESQILSILAPKLGVRAENIILKANELMNLTAIRSGSSSLAALNLSGSCKSVMCLELAALSFQQHVDRNTAIAVCGMQKKVYNSAFKALQCLLDLQPKTTVPDLTIQFGCPGVRSFALDVLKSYNNSQFGSDSAEYSQALFNCAAVYTACRKTKTKVEKPKLVEAAGVKKSTFDRLVAEMDKHAEKIIGSTGSARVGKGKRTRNFIEEIEAKSNDGDILSKTSKRDEAEETEEPYLDWKKRILTEAYQKFGKEYKPKVWLDNAIFY